MMSNVISYVNKTSMLEERIKQLEDEMRELYYSNTLSDEELVYTIKSSITKTFQSIGSPTYKAIPAVAVPIPDDFKTMIKSSANDISAIINDSLNLNKAQQSVFLNNQVFMTMISSKLSNISRKYSSIQNNIYSDTVNTNMVMISETFSNIENSGETSDNEVQANIDTTSGILTLGIKKQTKSSGTYADIVAGSNGYPGNTHTASNINNEVVFDGEGNLHMDLNEIIDGKADTWFEYEVYEINDETFENVAGLGLEYKEGMQWITDTKKLTLKLLFTLKKPDEFNMISITPYWPNVKGAKPPIVNKVSVISSDKSQSQTITNHQLFNDVIVALFKFQDVKYVEVELEQTAPYDVSIGHFFYTKENNTDIINGNTVRINGENPSVESLGLKFNPITKNIAQPTSYDEKGNPKVIDSEAVKSNLFNINNKHSNCIKELIPGKRYAIGIRDVDIIKNQFHESSIYVTKSFEMKDIINTITLEAEEYIPEEYGTSSEWIMYYISIDDGKEWLPIYPRYRGYKGASTYKINSTNIMYENDNNVKYIYKLEEPTNIKLKVEIKRPTDMPYSTPVVYSYTLSVRIGDEDID